jgi:precorrin-3B C17-methyltransferase
VHPLARKHLGKVLRGGKLLGIDKDCKYYPCHNGLEDCTFCYCPFYPCCDESTGGKWITETTWSCKDCNWVHRTEVASKFLEEIGNSGINKPEDIERNWDIIKGIREKVKALYPV